MAAPGRSAGSLRRVAPLLLLAAACAGPAGRPDVRPGSRAGWSLYRVGALGFEAPDQWEASGDARRLALVAPGEAARLQVWVGAGGFAGTAACLDDVEAALKLRESEQQRVQRHPTRLGGANAVLQEADHGSAHGWAYGVCTGGVQHWMIFTGRSPVAKRLLDEWRGVVESTRAGGGA
jgi:hypothetical protein